MEIQSRKPITKPISAIIRKLFLPSTSLFGSIREKWDDKPIYVLASSAGRFNQNLTKPVIFEMLRRDIKGMR
jgi:hypothetical protein